MRKIYEVKHIFIMWNYLISLSFILLNQCLQKVTCENCFNVFLFGRGKKITKFVLKGIEDSLEGKNTYFSTDNFLFD